MVGRLQRERAQAAKERALRERFAAAERERVYGQRAVFAAIPDGEEKAAAIASIIGRARTLLDVGQCEACDALLEFIPEEAADKFLNEYFG